jgi:osmotically-inducible protein OsmY
MTQDTQDIELQGAVEAQLQSDKIPDSANIAVAVKDRVVTLAGFARSFRQRRRAVAAVERVIGVEGSLTISRCVCLFCIGDPTRRSLAI